MNKIETYKLYNGDITLTFDPAKHLYTANGRKVYGVTGILSVISKPALMFWAVNMALEKIAKTLKPGVSYDEIQIKKMLDSAKKAHTEKKTSAADKGTMIHSWIEKYIKGENPELPLNEELKNAVLSFLSWKKDHNVKFLHSEIKVYSKRYNYAGTCDFIAEIDGKQYIGDIKTSSGIYPEMLYQTAAYQQARQEEYIEEYNGNIIVRCGKDGTLEIKESAEFYSNLSAFLGALALYERQQKVKDEEMKNLL